MNHTRTFPEAQGAGGGSDILHRIVETKRSEVAALLAREREIRKELPAAPAPRDLLEAFRRGDEVAVMAEVKRRSPGAGPIRPDLDPGDTALAYERAGAAAVSVLTDREYFGGSLTDLEAVRAAVTLPVFRKDFIIHPLQLAEARAAGADGVLLIVRILDDAMLRTLHEEARALKMTALVEVHDEEELDRALGVGAGLVGINNRNLRTFETSLDITLSLLPKVPPDVVVLSESGIRSGDDVRLLGAAGAQGVLVGESLLRGADPGEAAAELVGQPRVSRQSGEG